MLFSRQLRSAIFLLGAAAGLGLLSGCLHLEQKLHFQRDGSVVATYHYAIPSAMLPALTAAQEAIEQQQQQQQQQNDGNDGNNAPARPLNWFLNEHAVRDFFTRPGIEVRQYRQTERDGQTRVQIIILALDGARAVNTGLFGTMSMTRQENGHAALTVEPPGNNLPWTRTQTERLRQLCPDLKLVFTITAPADIITTNGALTEARTATWTFADDGVNNSPFAIIPALKATW